MFEFHHNTSRYFEHQRGNASKYVIPFIEKYHKIPEGARILEIGCGQGGVLQAFLDYGCEGIGVELSEKKFAQAEQMLASALMTGKAKLVRKNIYDADVEEDLGGKVDVIILKDVIEHIHDQEKLFHFMKNLLTKDGVIFFGFPPWQMPFGGHQQVCKTWISKAPWIHLLPRSWYGSLLKKYKEPVEDLLEIWDTGISIERFEKISKRTEYRIIHRTIFLLNPIYSYKFKWPVVKQIFPIQYIPYLRNFVSTCAYYVLKPL
jgi:SAM-dependent methyltransferase